ncbi:MAG: hypothetical protein RLZZ528_1595, partial [Pseudomonadota bacterium]
MTERPEVYFFLKCDSVMPLEVSLYVLRF